MINKEKILFPYPKVRRIQDEMIEEVDKSIKNKKNLIVHAPTGIGKTIAVLGPALAYAFLHNKIIFFLTSRHMQHHIVINTLKQIKEKFDKEIISGDIIGKQWMCAQPGVDKLYSNEFSEYCKKVREDNDCEFYFTGPVGFMRHVRTMLHTWGVPADHIHYECYGPHAADIEADIIS